MLKNWMSQKENKSNEKDQTTLMGSLKTFLSPAKIEAPQNDILDSPSNSKKRNEIPHGNEPSFITSSSPVSVKRKKKDKPENEQGSKSEENRSILNTLFSPSFTNFGKSSSMYLLSNDSTSSSEPVTPDQSHESIHHLNSKIPPFSPIHSKPRRLSNSDSPNFYVTRISKENESSPIDRLEEEVLLNDNMEMQEEIVNLKSKEENEVEIDDKEEEEEEKLTPTNDVKLLDKEQETKNEEEKSITRLESSSHQTLISNSNSISETLNDELPPYNSNQITSLQQNSHESYIYPNETTETTETEELDEELCDFDPFLFIKSLPPLGSDATSRACELPPLIIKDNYPKKTLVLDLDETLVHCTTNWIENPDLVFPVDFAGVTYRVYVLKRPHLETFLERASKLFEIVIFTASQRIYADVLLNLLDKEKKWIHHRLFRESCLYVEGNYLKELSILGRELSQTIIVDNSPQAFAYQLSNGIPILSWYENKEDRALLDLLNFLETVVDAQDVRPLIREKYQLFKKIESIV